MTSLPSSQEKKPSFFYGYIIVVAGLIIMMVVYGAQYSFGVFFKPLLQEFGWTRAATSGAFSLNVVLAGLFGMFAGSLTDRVGPRTVLTVCGLFMGVGYLLMPRVQAIWHVYILYGVFAGVGTSCFVPVMSTVARWFTKNRGLMSGIVIGGVGVGIAIMPTLANQLITRFNWRTAYTVVGSVVLLLIVIAAQLMKPNPHTEEVAAEGKGKEGISRTHSLTLGEAIYTKQLWIISAMLFISNYCLQVIMVHMVPYATDIGISAVMAASVLSVIGVFNTIGKLVMGNSLDKLGSKRIMAIAFSLFLGGFVWLQFSGQLWMLYLFSGIFALAAGGSAVAEAPIVAEYFGLKSHGAIFGVVSLILMVGGAIGPLVTGWIFDITNSYQIAFMLCAVVSLVGLFLLIPLKHIR